MESWSYISGGKGFVCDESVATPDLGIGRNKIGSLGWEFKAPFSPGSNMVIVSQNQEGNENQGFEELGFPPIIKNSAASGSIRDILGNKLGFGTMFNPGLAAQTAVSEEDESSSKLSSSVVESNSWDSALIDLKLGGLSDVQTFNYFKSSPNNYLSSAQLSVPSKRTKMVGCNSATPFCQVYGCKKNLSSSKDYHKRHKVCEVHSKTAKVIVNGIEQRFCQQCSRFHLLAEFDDGKRSCRKRLAGHNERRRKPHVGVHSTRPGRFLKSYNHSMKEGSRESTIAPSSFIFQDRLPTNFSNPYQQKYERNEWCHIKLEDRTTHDLQSLSSITDEPLHSKSLYASAFGRHYPSLQANGVNTAVGNIFNCSSNGNRYAHDIDASKFVMHSLFQSSSVSGGKEDFFILDSVSTGQPQLAIASETGCALSLLSSQSQTTRTPVTHSLLSPGNQTSHSHYGVTQIPEIDNPFGASPQASVTGLSTNMCPSGVGSVEASRLDPILISDGSDEANYDIDGMFYGSKYVNSRNPISCDDGSTIDLLKLSSQLQRVEHQKQGFRVKQENDSRFRLRIT